MKNISCRIPNRPTFIIGTQVYYGGLPESPHWTGKVLLDITSYNMLLIMLRDILVLDDGNDTSVLKAEFDDFDITIAGCSDISDSIAEIGFVLPRAKNSTESKARKKVNKLLASIIEDLDCFWDCESTDDMLAE